MNVITRKNKIKYIKNNLCDLPDENVVQVYNIMKAFINDETQCVPENAGTTNNLTNNENRDDGSSSGHSTTDEISIGSSASNENYTNDKKDQQNIETKQDRMKRIALEILNKILVEFGHKEINELCEFVEIKRDELIDDKCLKIINDNMKYIFKNGFNKTECNVYQKIKYLQLSILKGMMKQIGYVLNSRNKKKMINGISSIHTVYYVHKKIIT